MKFANVCEFAEKIRHFRALSTAQKGLAWARVACGCVSGRSAGGLLVQTLPRGSENRGSTPQYPVTSLRERNFPHRESFTLPLPEVPPRRARNRVRAFTQRAGHARDPSRLLPERQQSDQSRKRAILAGIAGNCRKKNHIIGKKAGNTGIYCKFANVCEFDGNDNTAMPQ